MAMIVISYQRIVNKSFSQWCQARFWTKVRRMHIWGETQAITGRQSQLTFQRGKRGVELQHRFQIAHRRRLMLPRIVGARLFRLRILRTGGTPKVPQGAVAREHMCIQTRQERDRRELRGQDCPGLARGSGEPIRGLKRRGRQ
jgi:hypothetical protein